MYKFIISAARSSHLFTIRYANRCASCFVNKCGDNLYVEVDDNEAILKVCANGSLKQVSGLQLAIADIVFIRKQVIEKNYQETCRPFVMPRPFLVTYYASRQLDCQVA